MDLFTTEEHYRNTRIRINGNTYDIDHDCVLRGVAEEDAQKLLGFASRVWRIWEGAHPAEVAKVRKQMAESKPKPEKKPEPIVEPEEEKEYPAPTMQMSKPELQEIAMAYEVEFSERTSKAELVRLIEAVMFEPVDE